LYCPFVPANKRKIKEKPLFSREKSGKKKKSVENCLTDFINLGYNIERYRGRNCDIYPKKIKKQNQEKYYEKNLSTQEKTEEQSTRFP
jgi:Zn-finger protein